jgi:hypothetical protein
VRYRLQEERDPRHSVLGPSSGPRQDHLAGGGVRMAKMMLLLLRAALLFVLCSCAAFQGGPDGSPAFDGDPDGADREEYETLEYLEEHPLDPMTAGPGELRSLPGFPERLVERLMTERRRFGTVRRLFEGLTPPERETLRRYEPYLELPGRLPLRLEGWYTADRLGPEGEKRDDIRFAFRSERLRMNARYRSEDIYRLYLSGFLPSGHVRLHAGDFMPDLGMGLCFNSYMTSYPFSGGYHIHRRRWVSSATSLYGASIRGGAVEIWAGPARMLLLHGRGCSYSDGRLDVEGPDVLCARLALARGGLSAGGTIHTVDGRSAGPVGSVDASWSRGRVDAAAEVAFEGGGWSGLWAVSVRGERSGMSMLIYGLPPEWDQTMGRSFYGAGRGRRGGSVVLDRRIGSHIRIFSAFERSEASDPYDERRRDLIRLECRWSAGPGSMKFSIKRRIERRSILMPYPSGEEQPGDDVTDSIHLLQTWRLAAWLRLRISCRGALEREKSGYLVCPSITIDRPLHVSLSWALHRAIEGTPILYCYERSLKGQYPWRALRGDAWRVALLARISLGPLRLAITLGAQNEDMYEGAAQMGIKF